MPKKPAPRRASDRTTDAEPKAILVPVEGGDVQLADEAYTRCRAMLATARMRRSARESGAGALTLPQINELIRTTRAARRRNRADE